MDGAIMHWNCRGLKHKLDEIKLFIREHNPIAICLQETFLTKSNNLSLKNYTLYSFDARDTQGRPSGGTCILVRKDISHSEVKLQTNLQAVAVKLALHRAVTLCSIYLPPSLRLNITDLEDLSRQLPGPYALLGDFNAHNILWGCADFNHKGQILEDFIDKQDLCLLNDKSKTYIHPATGSSSAIDLFLCDPLLYLDFSWKVGDDLCGSDHFPILITVNNFTPPQRESRWKLHKADWSKFKLLCENRITGDSLKDSADPIEQFNCILTSIAEECIPKSSTKFRRPHLPWFNEDCKNAILQRRKALKIFNRNPTRDNLFKYKNLQAKARRVIRRAKRNSWREYVSQLNSRTPIKQTWNIIRKISGKQQSSPLKFLNSNNGDKATTPKEIANTLGETFQNNSSSQHYTPTFQKYKKRKRNINLISNRKTKNRTIALSA